MPELTRARLYNLVWTKPLRTIAQEYSLDPIHLAKACDAYDVARPPAGYWQKMEHGKSVQRPPLSNETFGPEDIPELKQRNVKNDKK
ncbi:hypothetical protein PX860_26415 (plasmid) [Agrobacterium leguminum]|uniref:hypothetical protein n=1 Tax=Agrobacterium leguminum TaxID=2792015 RepID=UPI00272B6DE1|nr:hypothetical protein [Agrobacterium leguminum]WLE00436.1 hypothetical protein PX860_26415 [Agrobacterium leguminum]